MDNKDHESYEDELDMDEENQPDLDLATFLNMGNCDALEDHQIYRFTSKTGWTLREVALLPTAFEEINDYYHMPTVSGDTLVRATRLDSDGVVIRKYSVDSSGVMEIYAEEHLYPEIEVQGKNGVIFLKHSENVSDSPDSIGSNYDPHNIYMGTELAEQLVVDLQRAIKQAKAKE